MDFQKVVLLVERMVSMLAEKMAVMTDVTMDN